MYVKWEAKQEHLPLHPTCLTESVASLGQILHKGTDFFFFFLQPHLNKILSVISATKVLADGPKSPPSLLAQGDLDKHVRWSTTLYTTKRKNTLLKVLKH